jgi:hypothetical protein
MMAHSGNAGSQLAEAHVALPHSYVTVRRVCLARPKEGEMNLRVVRFQIAFQFMQTMKKSPERPQAGY